MVAQHRLAFLTSHQYRMDIHEQVLIKRLQVAATTQRLSEEQGELEELVRASWEDPHEPKWYFDHLDELASAVNAVGHNTHAKAVVQAAVDLLITSGTARIGWHHGMLRITIGDTSEDAAGAFSLGVHLQSAGFQAVSVDVDGKRYVMKGISTWQDVDSGATGNLVNLRNAARVAH